MDAIVKCLTHTARMLSVLAVNPDHARAGGYRKQIAAYSLKWESLSADERATAREIAETHHDMTAASVAAAVTALEA